MTIDPRITFWFGVWTSVLLLVASGTINFTGALPDLWVPVVTKWCGILGAINSTILTAASGYSSNKTGPMVNASVISTSAVAKVLIAAFALSMFLAGGSAMAATAKPAAPAAKTCLIPFDPLKLCGALSGNVSTDIQRVATRIAKINKADLIYAAAKAKAANTAASGIRLQCVQAISDANDQFNGAGLKNADGSAMVRPDPAVVTAIEDIAELIDNLSPQGKLFTSCAGAAQMFKTDTLTAINGIVTGAVGLATASAVGL